MRHPLTCVLRLDEIVPHLRLLRIHLVLGGVQIGSYIASLILIKPRGWTSMIVHSLSGLRTLLITQIVEILLLKMRCLIKVILRNIVATLNSFRGWRHHLPKATSPRIVLGIVPSQIKVRAVACLCSL